jgi:hypothetical protein|tara:strand:+ start:5603 stop:5878 length:276 start_codon:yes stop_codon:yes gene_type:complete
MKSAFSKNLSILVLSLMLSLPGFVIADHIHETTAEEINCELCTHTGSDVALDNVKNDLSAPARQKAQRFSRRFAISTELLHRHPRGPPLHS